MKIIFYLLLIVFIISDSSTYEYEFSDESKSRLVNKFRDKFLNSLNQYFHNKSSSELANTQVDFLKLRNFECPKEHAKIEKLFADSKKDFENLLTKWPENADNMSEEIEYKIIDDINKICLDSNTLATLFQIGSLNETLNNDNLAQILINQFINDGCNLCKPHEEGMKHKTFKTWIYGLIAASIITASSFTGGLLYPLTKHKHYNKVLMFLLAVAIGTLIGTSIIHLIPHAFGISDDPNYSINDAFKWKALVILSGLYFFFIIEQLMTLLTDYKQAKSNKKTSKRRNKYDDSSSSSDSEKNEMKTLKSFNNEQYGINQNNISGSRFLAGSQLNVNKMKSSTPGKISTMAWIIICSEGLHNMLDGLSIGAAFTEDVLRGASLSLAIICEEFPHKLGDFAILLTCGMSFKLALFCNFLTSSLIFAGIAIGITLGENLNANQWIYAVAAGMFLYVSVCDMIPELVKMGLNIERESLNNRNGNNREIIVHSHSHSHSHDAESDDKPVEFSFKIKFRNMLIQHLGLLIGFFLMFILAVYSDKITL